MEDNLMDTPEQLKARIEKIKADKKRELFLTKTGEMTDQLLKGILKDTKEPCKTFIDYIYEESNYISQGEFMIKYYRSLCACIDELLIILYHSLFNSMSKEAVISEFLFIIKEGIKCIADMEQLEIIEEIEIRFTEPDICIPAIKNFMINKLESLNK